MAMPTAEDLADQVEALQSRSQVELASKIIAVWSSKGGVGKSEIAKELAYITGGVLVDFDWDSGNVTTALGYFHERFVRVPLLDALELGRPPFVKKMRNRPDLVPGHPEFGTSHPSAEVLSKNLISWATAWNRPVVVDCHPGGGVTQFGAIAAADAIVSPVELSTRELNATEGQLKELGAYPMYLVPNQVSSTPPMAQVERLEDLSRRYDIPVGPPVYYQSWLPQRQLRTVVCASPPYSKRVSPFVSDMVKLGEGVLNYVNAV